MNLSGRLVLGTFTVAVCTLLVLLWGSERALESELETAAQSRLDSDAKAIAAGLSPDPLLWAADAQRMSVQTGHRIVVRFNDTLVAATDSIREPRFLSSRATRGLAVVEVSTSLRATEGVARLARNAVIGPAFVALAVALGLAALTGRLIAAPLTEMSRAALSIAAGAAPRFPRSNIPEVDALVGTLRTMHGQLGSRFAALEREKAETAAIVESMVEGIIATDARGAIVTVNAAAQRLLGYEAGATMPNISTLFRVKDAREAVEQVLAGASIVDRELELGGAVLAMNARPLPGGGAVVVLHDLTEVRRLEAVRRDFVANVSHELKTPLTSISGYAETLMDETIDAESRRRFVGTIHSNARRMQHLVDDLLDLSRIEAGRWTPSPETVNIEATVREAWADIAERASARQVTLTLRAEPDATTAHVDREAVGHVLGNLLDNSLRHVPDGGRITVHAARESDGVVISVIDNGSGIPSEHLPRIFERFYRADPSRSRDQGGTGLGLAIVKHLVEAHRGTATIESAPRQGTTVKVWFPDA